MLRDKKPTPGDVARLQAEVAKLTAEFRSATDGPYLRIRELLIARAIQPANSMLVQLHSEDTNAFLGIVVTSSRHVFLFRYDFLRVPIERGDFREWTELTGQSTHVEYRAFVEQIECGLALVQSLPRQH